MHTTHFGTNNASQLVPKIIQIIPDEIKIAQNLFFSKSKVTSWTKIYSKSEVLLNVFCLAYRQITK